MAPSRLIKRVQRLIGRLTTLNQFISRSKKHTLPLFKISKCQSNFIDIEKHFQLWVDSILSKGFWRYPNFIDDCSFEEPMSASESPLAIITFPAKLEALTKHSLIIPT